MIQHADIYQCQRISQAQGDALVGLTGFGDTGGMIVREDQRRCIQGQGALHYVARVDTAGIERALE